MKPHIFAQMVNEVRDLARQYGQVEQFRCRVADLLGKYIHVEHNSKGMPEQTEAQAVVVPDLEDGDYAWQDAAFKGVNYSSGLRDGYNLAKSRACAIPADRVLGDENQFGVGFVEACGMLAAKPFDRPTLAAGLIREGGMIAALAETPSDGPGISILREEMQADLDALRANQGGTAT